MAAAGPSLARVLEALDGKGCRYRARGYRVMAACPAHEDRVPSLSITYAPGEDGRVLLHCHGGCGPAAVLAALGLRWRDLYDTPARSSPPATRQGSFAARPPLAPDLYEFLAGPPLASRVMTARATRGWCAWCTDPLRQGTRIALAGGRWYHLACHREARRVRV